MSIPFFFIFFLLFLKVQPHKFVAVIESAKMTGEKVFAHKQFSWSGQIFGFLFGAFIKTHLTLAEAFDRYHEATKKINKKGSGPNGAFGALGNANNNYKYMRLQPTSKQTTFKPVGNVGLTAIKTKNWVNKEKANSIDVKNITA